MVMEFNSSKNYPQIKRLINVLGQDFATSKDNNKRKGGLLGLAATSIGLGKVCYHHNHLDVDSEPIHLCYVVLLLLF